MSMENCCVLSVQITPSQLKTFFVDLFYPDTGGAFDLTGMTEIAASFPGASGVPIIERYSQGEIAVSGPAGGGQIEITCAAQDTAMMLTDPSPDQFQTLQIIVTIAGVAQVDVISITGSVTPGAVYTATIAGQTVTYTASNTDNTGSVLAALLALIVALELTTLTAAISGSTIVLTAIYPALGFSDTVSSTLTKVASILNSGTRAIILIPNCLNIQPQPYVGS